MRNTLEKELKQQPEVISRILNENLPAISEIVKDIRQYSFDHIVIVARGSSDNVARYGKYLFGYHNDLFTGLAAPSLYTLYQSPPKLKNTLMLVISQSGQSPDLLEVVKTSKQQGVPTLAITNTPDSPVAQQSRWCIDLLAGKEKAVAATKTYTSSLISLAAFSALLSEDHQLVEELHQVPQRMNEVIEEMDEYLPHFERYAYMNHCVVVGRGFNYGTAFEISLKIKELTGIISEPYSSADFMHGPVTMLEKRFPIIAIGASGDTLSDLQDLVTIASNKASEIISFSDDDYILKKSSLPVPIPTMPEWLSPLVTVIPGQYMAMRMAQARGMDPDFPQDLQKVTKTI